MSIREKYKQQREDMARRATEDAARPKEGFYPIIFNRNLIPANCQIWYDKEGMHDIDVLPFPCGPTHPDVVKGYRKIGDFVYQVPYWEHTRIGVRELPFCCPTMMYDKLCPIDVHMKKQRLEKEIYNALRAKERRAYLIWCHDTPEEEKKGVQIWAISWGFFGEYIDAIHKIPARGGGIAGVKPFWDPEIGETIRFTKKVKSKTNFDYIGHSFIPRSEPIPDNILEQVFDLAACIKLTPTFEEINQAFTGCEISKDTAAPTTQAPSPPAASAPDIKTETQPAETKQPVQTPPPAPPAAEPVQEKKLERPAPAATIPSTPANTAGTNFVCPNKGTFGKDFNSIPGCDKCSIWDNCADESERLSKQG